MTTLFVSLVIVLVVAAIGNLMILLQIRDRLDGVVGSLKPGAPVGRSGPVEAGRQV